MTLLRYLSIVVLLFPVACNTTSTRKTEAAKADRHEEKLSRQTARALLKEKESQVITPRIVTFRLASEVSLTTDAKVESFDLGMVKSERLTKFFFDKLIREGIVEQASFDSRPCRYQDSFFDHSCKGGSDTYTYRSNPSPDLTTLSATYFSPGRPESRMTPPYLIFVVARAELGDVTGIVQASPTEASAEITILIQPTPLYDRVSRCIREVNSEHPDLRVGGTFAAQISQWPPTVRNEQKETFQFTKYDDGWRFSGQ